jgi:hypothetical protein
MLAVQRDKEKRRRGAHPTELFQLMLGFLLRAALELMKSPTDSLEDPELRVFVPRSRRKSSVGATRARALLVGRSYMEISGERG